MYLEQKQKQIYMHLKFNCFGFIKEVALGNYFYSNLTFYNLLCSINFI